MEWWLVVVGWPLDAALLAWGGGVSVSVSVSVVSVWGGQRTGAHPGGNRGEGLGEGGEHCLEYGLLELGGCPGHRHERPGPTGESVECKRHAAGEGNPNFSKVAHAPWCKVNGVQWPSGPESRFGQTRRTINIVACILLLLYV